jgi:hypothetical protein
MNGARRNIEPCGGLGSQNVQASQVRLYFIDPARVRSWRVRMRIRSASGACACLVGQAY